MSEAYDQVHEDENEDVHMGSIYTWTRMHTHKGASFKHPLVYASMLIRGLIYDCSGINFLVSIKTCNHRSQHTVLRENMKTYPKISSDITLIFSLGTLTGCLHMQFDSYLQDNQGMWYFISFSDLQDNQGMWYFISFSDLQDNQAMWYFISFSDL